MADATTTRARGRLGEDRASHFLEERGLEIVARNVELCGVELDLIAVASDDLSGAPTYVFIEVRGRLHVRQGHPLETVGARKRARLIRGAKAWLVTHELWERVAVRFDVVTLVGGVERLPKEIAWIQGAFTA